MSDQQRLPEVPDELLDHLHARYPDSMRHRIKDLEDLRFRQGQQDVIRHLEKLAAAVREENLSDTSMLIR